MKKTALIVFTMLLTCAVFAQDSTKTQGQHHTMAHKKTMHKSSPTTPIDSVNGGKVTTNPSGKIRKPKNSAASPDSTK